MLSRDFSKQTCRYLELVTNFRCSRVAIEIYKAKKYRKNKKIDIIEAIHLVERASSLHAYWRLEPVAQIVWSQKLNRKKNIRFQIFFFCVCWCPCVFFLNLDFSMSIQTQPSAELSEEISIAYFWRSWKRELKKTKNKRIVIHVSTEFIFSFQLYPHLREKEVR